MKVLLSLLFLPAALPLAAQGRLTFSGLQPDVSLTEFASHANRIAAADSVTCRTSHRTAALMECGVVVADGPARPHVGAFIIAGRVAMVAVTDSGGDDLVARWRERFAVSFGPGTLTSRAMIQWVRGETVARLTWRGAGDHRRWVSLTITHDPTLARIRDYLPGAGRPATPRP